MGCKNVHAIFLVIHESAKLEPLLFWKTFKMDHVENAVMSIKSTLLLLRKRSRSLFLINFWVWIKRKVWIAKSWSCKTRSGMWNGFLSVTLPRVKWLDDCAVYFYFGYLAKWSCEVETSNCFSNRFIIQAYLITRKCLNFLLAHTVAWFNKTAFDYFSHKFYVYTAPRLLRKIRVKMRAFLS